MLRGFGRAAACVAVFFLAAGAAAADEEIHYGPIPAWVKVATIEAASAVEDEGFARIVLFDTQVRHGPDGDEIYSDRAIQALNRQGLELIGTVGQIWNPGTQSLTVHKVEIIRDGEVIDALAKGDPLVVLRQETNLSRAILDGQLTATKQLQDVRVGDIVRVVATIRHADPMMKGHSQYMSVVPDAGTTAHMRERHLWAADRPIRWRAAEGYPKPVQSRTAEGFELVAEARDVKAPVAPAGAPGRYRLIGMMSVSDFASWREVSALFASDYAAAATLEADSPIKAEAQTIMQAHASAQDRASAALALVQERVRYMALAMGQGGYKPAPADLTWTRKFGDCKGKSALLVALLAEMGIESEVVAVSSGGGDGIDDILPSVVAFDHVIVRVRIGGKTYWLDPTRFGDGPIEDLAVPGYRWVLPIRGAGADLEALHQIMPKAPSTEARVDVDFTGGLDIPAPLKVRLTYRGDEAVYQYATMSAAPRADTERELKETWTTDNWIIETATFGRDDKGETFVDLTGTQKAMWPRVGAARQYEVWMSAISAEFEPREPDAVNPKAPYAIPFPQFERYASHIRLPRGGEGFTIVGRDVDIKAAGYWIVRRSRMEDGVVIVEEDDRTTVSEIPFAEATSGPDKLKAAGITDEVIIRAPSNFRMTAADAEAAVAARPDRATYMVRAQASLAQGDYAAAMEDYNRVLDADPEDVWALSGRGWVRFRQGDSEAGLKDYETALSLSPQNVSLLADRAAAYLSMSRNDLALADAETMVAAAPNDWRSWRTRAQARDRLGDREGSLSDLERAVQLDPDNLTLRETQIYVTYRDSSDKAARYAALEQMHSERIEASPEDPQRYLRRASVRQAADDTPGAMEDYAKAIALSPSAETYLARAQAHRGAGARARALADMDAAVKVDTGHSALLARARYSSMQGTPAQWLSDANAALDRSPSDPAVLEEVARAALVVGDKFRAAGAATDLVRQRPDRLASLRLRALVKQQAGDLAGAIADMRLALATADTDKLERTDASLRLATLLTESGDYAGAIAQLDSLKTDSPQDAEVLGALCRIKGTRDVEATSAPADCRAALAIRPDDPDHLDSLGFAYLRLGRFDEAIAAYDQALEIRPGQTTSLYGRALAREGHRDLAGAREDARLASRFYPDALKEMIGYGIVTQDEGVAQALAAEPVDVDKNLPAGAVVTRPDWAAGAPTPRYPDRALAQSREGRASARCIVMSTGVLSNCRVENERPHDFGFGATVLKATSDFRMKPMTVDGVAIDGAEVTVPMNFRF